MLPTIVFHDPVSRRITASVATHIGAATYQASSESAVGSGHCAAISGPSASAADSFAADSA
jgi:hypothetical protein